METSSLWMGRAISRNELYSYCRVYLSVKSRELWRKAKCSAEMGSAGRCCSGASRRAALPKTRGAEMKKWLRIFGAICQNRSVSTLSLSVLVKRSAVSSYLRRLSLRFLLKRNLLRIRRENGPGGIRTRICDCDRVLCSPYTTGPACSVPRLAQDHKAMRHSSRIRVSNWKIGGSSRRLGTDGAS